MLSKTATPGTGIEETRTSLYHSIQLLGNTPDSNTIANVAGKGCVQ